MAGIRLRDIAARANVATSTVSRVLSGYPYVSPATREAVWRALEEMGVDRYALQEKNRVLSTIVLTDMCPPPKDPRYRGEHSIGTEFAHQVLIGAQTAIRYYNDTIDIHLVSGNLIAVHTGDHQSSKRDEGHALYTNNRTGYLLIGGQINHELVQQLRTTRTPFVIVGARPETIPADSVMADYIGGVEQAVQHLVQRGRRIIGLIKGSPATLTSHEKYKGFRLALCQRNLPFMPEQIMETENFAPEAADQPTRRLVEQVKGLDAIIYGDDYLAMGGIHTLRQMGISIPDDVAVVGFHDYRIAPYTNPPLTTIRIDGYQMGLMAVQRLSLIFETYVTDPWTIIAPTTLVVRSSA